MNFRSQFEEKLRKIERFKGVTCGASMSTIIESYNYFGYKLDSCFATDRKGVSAGLLIEDGYVCGIAYQVEGQEMNAAKFTSGLCLDRLDVVLDELVNLIAMEPNIGNEFWIRLNAEEPVEAAIQSKDALICKETGNKLFKFDSVCVDTGFSTMFSSMVFGYDDEKYVLALLDTIRYQENGSLKKVYIPSFEASFSSAKEGNALFSKIMQSRFLSKKGNVIYKISQNDFVKFHRVTGSSFLIE